MLQKYFNRFEIKYQISIPKRDNVIRHIKPFMELDPYIKNNHNYEVRSLYFDSLFKKAYYEKIDGIKTRIKLRIRYYPNVQNKESKRVFIELKRKLNEIIVKSRILVPFEDALEIIDADTNKARIFYENASKEDKKVLEEIWFLYKRFNLRPVCIVCYYRQPYMSKVEDRFRITFDTNVKVRNYNFDLNFGGGSKYIVPPQICVMEVKFTSFIPNWAVIIVQRNNVIQEKISKFASGLEKADVINVL